MSQPETQNTEIAHVDSVQVDSDISQLVTQPTTGALRRLEAEVAALDKAFHWAKAISKTTMVPPHFQQTHIPKGSNQPLGEVAAYNLAAAVMYGMEIGLSAMQSAQNVFVVKGKPAVYARTMAGQVRQAGYVLEEVEASDEKVVWKAFRDGVWAFSEWDIRRATTAGYTSNELYQRNPQEMLRAKCIAEVCRIKFQDILLGMAYSVEDLQLQEVTVSRPIKQGARGTAALREIAEAIAEAKTEDGDGFDDQGNRITPAEPDNGSLENNTLPGVTVVDPDCTPSSNAQLTEIRKQYKARNISGQALLDELGQYLQRKIERLDVASISHADAVSILAMLAGNADS
jgi:hypothetical protein